MESCLICRDSSASIYTWPIATVNQLIQQCGEHGQDLQFNKPSEGILCEDCRLGVEKATEWGAQKVEVERDVRSLQRIILKLMCQLQTLQGKYLEEMKGLVGKIKGSSDRAGSANWKAGAFRQVILNVVMDLDKFQDELSTRVVNTVKSTTVAEQQVAEIQTQETSSQSESVEVNGVGITINVDDDSEAEEGDQAGLEEFFAPVNENSDDAEHSREHHSVTGTDETACTSMPGPLNPCSACPSESPEQPQARVNVIQVWDPMPNPDVAAAAPNLPLNNVALNNLLEYLIVNNVRYLRIQTYPELCKFNYTTYFRQLSNYIKKSTPGSIENICLSKMHTDVQIYGTAWRELLAVLGERVTEVIVLVSDFSAPNIPTDITFSKLTTLRVRKENTDPRDWIYFSTMLECSPNLKTLELEQTTYEILRKLSEMEGLKLQTFILRLLSREGTRPRNSLGEDGFEVFLKAQKNTLTRLVLGADIDVFRTYPNIVAALPNVRITTE